MSPPAWAETSRSLVDALRVLAAGADTRVQSEVLGLLDKAEAEMAAAASAPGDDGPSSFRAAGKGESTQVLKKVSGRLQDFESQITAQLSTMQADFDKKFQHLSRGAAPVRAEGSAAAPLTETGSEELAALRFDVSELKDAVNSVKNDAGHVKRIVLACERDMEDFTAAMDAVNVDLDEMRSRVDSTHSIITSRQRVEATVTAEISTMRLDMGDMQEALKAHDAWMEDVSQSLQECHERCSGLEGTISELRASHQAKLDAKVEVMAWRDKNEDIEAFIKSVRDMASALQLEVDARRRHVDQALEAVRADHARLGERLAKSADELSEKIEGEAASWAGRQEEARAAHEALTLAHEDTCGRLDAAFTELSRTRGALETALEDAQGSLQRAVEDRQREAAERSDALDKAQINATKELTRRANALELRLSGLQGACGEHKRDIGKLREEVNGLAVRSASHEVDIAKALEDVRKVDKARQEDCMRQKQDMDAVYEELDQKLYEKTHLALEDNVMRLCRGVVKLCQVVGVFPGARMDDGTEEELDIDVELLNWEDCCQNMVQRVEKTWRQHSSHKYKNLLDLVSRKADHSVLRLLQISQQHIESQLERVRHERELWKEVVDKRAQQPLQLALTLKEQQQQLQQSGLAGSGLANGSGGLAAGAKPGWAC